MRRLLARLSRLSRPKAGRHFGRLAWDAREALQRAEGIARSFGRSEASTVDLLLALLRERSIRWSLETLAEVDVLAAEFSLSRLLAEPLVGEQTHLQPLNAVVREAVSKVSAQLFATSSELWVSAIESASGEVREALDKAGLLGEAAKRAVLGPERAIALRHGGAVYLYVDEAIDRIVAERILYEGTNAAMGEDGSALLRNLEAVGDRMNVDVRIDSSRRDEEGIIYQVDYISRTHAAPKDHKLGGR